MAQRKIVLEELEALNSLKDLAESYEEIAVVRMQKIKDTVAKSLLKKIWLSIRASWLVCFSSILLNTKNNVSYFPKS